MKRLPSNLEAEQAVLGSMLIERAAVDKASALLQPEDFYFEDHRHLFEVMLALTERRKPVELITVHAELLNHKTDALIQPDSLQTLHFLQNLMEAPSSAANVEHYASLVKTASTCRLVMERAKQAYFLARNSETGLQEIASGNGHYHLSELAKAGEGSTLRPVCLADVQPERIAWLWQGFIPFGMITLLSGDPGMGKGTICIDLAARLSRGIPFPLNELAPEPMNVLLITAAEDDVRCTIVPRLLAANADMRRIFVVEDLISFPADVEQVEDLIRRHQIRLVVIDPLNAYLSSKVDGHKDQDIRLALTPLKLVAERTRAAILIVAHLNKGNGNALYRTGGSIAIPGVSRMAFVVGRHPDDPGRRILAIQKSNIAQPPPSLSYSLVPHAEHEVGMICWHETVEYRADDILAPPRPQPTQEPTSKLEEAKAFYLEILADGKEHRSTEVEAERKDRGISERTAKRAREELNVRSRKEGLKGGWLISLPEECQNTPKSAIVPGGETVALFEENWHSSEESEPDPHTAIAQDRTS